MEKKYISTLALLSLLILVAVFSTASLFWISQQLKEVEKEALFTMKEMEKQSFSYVKAMKNGVVSHVKQAKTLDTIQQAQIHFNDMIYWLTEVALSFSDDAVKRADIAKIALLRKVGDLKDLYPKEVKIIQSKVEPINDAYMEAFDNYFDEDRKEGRRSMMRGWGEAEIAMKELSKMNRNIRKTKSRTEVDMVKRTEQFSRQYEKYSQQFFATAAKEEIFLSVKRSDKGNLLFVTMLGFSILILFASFILVIRYIFMYSDSKKRNNNIQNILEGYVKKEEVQVLINQKLQSVGS